MNVRELIARLQEFDGDLPVTIPTDEDTLAVAEHGLVTHAKLLEPGETYQSHEWPEPRVLHQGPAVVLF